MPYRFLENTATADTAFEVWNSTIEGLFTDAANALLNVMVHNISEVRNEREIDFEIEDDSLELLLFNVLQELLFQKDANLYLLRINDCGIREEDNRYHCKGVFTGEHIDYSRHKINVDVKAVTFHNYFVKKEKNLWWGRITLDI